MLHLFLHRSCICCDTEGALVFCRYLTGTLMGLDIDGRFPDNLATGMMAKGMVKAWQLYGREK